MYIYKIRKSVKDEIANCVTNESCNNKDGSLKIDCSRYNHYTFSEIHLFETLMHFYLTSSLYVPTVSILYRKRYVYRYKRPLERLMRGML